MYITIQFVVQFVISYCAIVSCVLGKLNVYKQPLLE